jgi:hypothetical protein
MFHQYDIHGRKSSILLISDADDSNKYIYISIYITRALFLNRKYYSLNIDRALNLRPFRSGPEPESDLSYSSRPYRS